MATPHAETANNSDASLSDPIESDHDGHRDCKYDQGCAALPGASSPLEHDRGDACEQRDGEDHAAGPREPKPLAEPSPVASRSKHVRDARSDVGVEACRRRKQVTTSASSAANTAMRDGLHSAVPATGSGPCSARAEAPRQGPQQTTRSLRSLACSLQLAGRRGRD